MSYFYNNNLSPGFTSTNFEKNINKPIMIFGSAYINTINNLLIKEHILLNSWSFFNTLYNKSKIYSETVFVKNSVILIKS